MIDIKSSKCIQCKIKQPIFGYKDKKASHCKKCKLEDMIDIKSSKCINCKIKQPSYGYENDKKATYCNDCKKEGMINITSPKCKTDLCRTQIRNKNYKGYCAYCYMHLFPDKPILRNYKTKEYVVVDFIKTNFNNIDIIHNKKIYDGCSGKQPDILIDLGKQIIIIEIDENQHKYYSCENKRIMELSQDVNHRPIVFIRFNPDKYKTNLGNITSCWKINKNGICIISKQKEWNERLNTLKNTIIYWIKNKTEKTIELVQLYFDEEST
jgi:hypothetical protein